MEGAEEQLDKMLMNEENQIAIISFILTTKSDLGRRDGDFAAHSDKPSGTCEGKPKCKILKLTMHTLNTCCIVEVTVIPVVLD